MIWLFVSVIVLVATGLTGCRDTEEKGWREFEADLAMKHLADPPQLADAGVRTRAKAAQARLQNGTLDRNPILIYARLGLPDGNQPKLFPTSFDEDEDLRGLRIIEEHLDPNGKSTLIEEDYPIYVAWARTPIFDPTAIPVEVRAEGKRKDERLWRDYIIRALDDVVRRQVDERLTDYKRLKLPPDKEMLDAMPPVYMSVPEPNKVRVVVSVYDRAGNESEGIELYVTSYERRELQE